MLEIKNLHANVDGKPILKGITLTIATGEVVALMGTNGSGKSTLSKVIAGHPDYEVTEGSITWNGVDMLTQSPEERAHTGVFLAFQYPVEIPGVSTANFLKAAVNAVRVGRGQEALDAYNFLKTAREKMKIVNMSDELLKRPLNEGFSGGEKKRNEVFQMLMLEPSLCLLDETDSGLDVDALRTVASGVNAMRNPERSMIVITHYQRLLDTIVPDRTLILRDGRIILEGGADLAKNIEDHGYKFVDDQLVEMAK